MKRVVGIVQARMSSTRLPGKVLRPILGKPMLYRQLERIQRCNALDAVAVATSTESTDDCVVMAAESLGVQCVRGPLADVLDRYRSAAALLGADVIVRLTADCPLCDATVIDEVVELHLSGGYDYTSNFIERRYPVGLDAEAFNRDILEAAWMDAVDPPHREHVTPWMYGNASLRLGSLRNEHDQSGMRWTVDEPKDFDFVREVYGRLYPDNPTFCTADILALLEREPALAMINAPG
jgi:spore coat polysaccharide biosynthesis protein SpsF (cytidylyltransferase family)